MLACKVMFASEGRKAVQPVVAPGPSQPGRRAVIEGAHSNKMILQVGPNTLEDEDAELQRDLAACISALPEERGVQHQVPAHGSCHWQTCSPRLPRPDTLSIRGVANTRRSHRLYLHPRRRSFTPSSTSTLNSMA